MTMMIIKVLVIRQLGEDFHLYLAKRSHLFRVVTQLFLKSITCLSAENIGYSALKFKFNLNNKLSSPFVEHSRNNETNTSNETKQS